MAVTSLQMPSCAGLSPTGGGGGQLRRSARVAEMCPAVAGLSGSGWALARGPLSPPAGAAHSCAPQILPELAQARRLPEGGAWGGLEPASRPGGCHRCTGSQAAPPVARPQWAPLGPGARGPASGYRADPALPERGCGAWGAGGPRYPVPKRGGGDLLGPGPERLVRATPILPLGLPQWR